MRRTLSLPDGLAMSRAFAGLLAMAAAGVQPGARGQEAKAETPKAEAPNDEAPEAVKKPAPWPASDIFVKPPTTPMEFWDAADFLIRTGQVKQAVPYLNGFLKSNPDDETLVQIRDHYGARSILQLDQYPETRPLAAKVIPLLNAAARRHATRPERMERFINALTKSREEQMYAVDRLSEAGPYAVPFLVRALQGPRLTPDDRRKIVYNMGRLDTAAVPALIAVLDSPDAALVANAADALGRIGDRRAVPQLTFLAAEPNMNSPARGPARHAIEALTGRAFESQPLSPVRLLTAEARRYHLHEVRFPGGLVVVWEWNQGQQAPVPRQVPQTEAEACLGLKYAREALLIDPADRPAQVVLVSLALEKAIERASFAAFPANDPTGAFPAALAAGPVVLVEVARTAIADGKTDLAAVAVTSLGRVIDANAVTTECRSNPLVEALSAPSRRVQFAAARALVLLNPRQPFAGSSRIVPVLAWFVTNQAAPRAVVIDGNPTRGGQLAGHLKSLGYEPELTATGDQGFRAASERADVELILIDHHLIQGDWRVVDTVANLHADARTAGIPIYIVGPLDLEERLSSLKANYPGVKFVVQPTTAPILEQQLGGRPTSLSAAERAGYARAAAALLARIASEPGSPFEPDLARVESALTIALNTPPTSLAASAVLGDVPQANAQRGLADIVLDPGKPPQLRLNTTYQLARSLQRFGPLVTADQEVKLLAAFDQERDPALRGALASAVGALRPQPTPTGLRLRQYPSVAATPPAQVPPASVSVPSPPTPDTAPPTAEPPASAAEAKP